MENNTKIAIGLAAAVVVGYLVYKGSKPKAPVAKAPIPNDFPMINTFDPYICPNGYTLGTKQLFESQMWVCKDLKGNLLDIQDGYGNLINGVKVNPTYRTAVVDCNKAISENKSLFITASNIGGMQAYNSDMFRKDAMQKINELGLSDCFQDYKNSLKSQTN